MTSLQHGHETENAAPPTSLDELAHHLKRAVRKHQRRMQVCTAQLVHNVTQLDEQFRARELSLHPQHEAGTPEPAGLGFPHSDLLEQIESCIRTTMATSELQGQPAAGVGNAADGQVEWLREENNRLLAEIEQLQLKAQFDVPPTAEMNFDGDAEQRIAELEKQLQNAHLQAEEFRLQNEELAARVATSRADSDSSSSAGGALSWEEQKERLLQQLEHEDGDTEPVVSETGEALDDFVKRTERIIAEKDAELAELKQLLAEQADATSGIAVGAAAIADMLDQDELIREEREKLQEIQKQWREKLRNAEIELSLERAQLSRQRIELEERIAELEEGEERLKTRQDETEPVEEGNARKWLSRLGLDSDSAE